MGFRAYKCLVTLFLCSLLTFFLSSCVLNIKNPLRYYLWPVETPPLKEIAKKDQVASKSPSRKDSLVSAANSDGNVEITLSQAILVGLQNNKVFQVDKLKPPITSSAEEVERAAFDPVVRTALEKSRLRSDFYTVNKDVTGLSLVWLGVNRATGDVNGVEIGLGNWVEGASYGGQLGIVNHAAIHPGHGERHTDKQPQADAGENKFAPGMENVTPCKADHGALPTICSMILMRLCVLSAFLL